MPTYETQRKLVPCVSFDLHVRHMDDLTTVTDTVVANNGGKGMYALSSYAPAPPPTVVMVRNSTIANNGAGGLVADGSGATVRVTRSTITRNATGWAALNLGTLSSYGDNNVDGNTTDGNPTHTIPTK